MSDNMPETEAPCTFHKWEKLLDELRRHTLSFFDKESLRNYSQCSKRSNEEVQKYDTKNPLKIEVKDLRNSKMGVMVTMEYKEKVRTHDDYYHGTINRDVVEALIEISTERGDVVAADTARNELQALRAEQLELNEYEDKLTRIVARLLNVNEPDAGPRPGLVEARLDMENFENIMERAHGRFLHLMLVEEGADAARLFHNEVQERAHDRLIERGLGHREMETRRRARIEREDAERRIEISFVAVGPAKHKMILNRSSDVEDGTLEGNAVDAAYEYLARRFGKRKNGRTQKITLDVKKWPTKLMESEAIQQGVAKWDVTMYRTIYEEFMEHMRMDTNPKNINIHPGYGMGYKFKLPSEIFTIFQAEDKVIVNASCQLSDDAIHQTNIKSLLFPADAITDMGINAKIRQLIDSGIETDIHVYRSRKTCPEREQFDKTVILEDLPVMPRFIDDDYYRVRRTDGKHLNILLQSGECRIWAEKTDNN